MMQSVQAEEASTSGRLFSFGVISDIQYANIPDGFSFKGTARYYRWTPLDHLLLTQVTASTARAACHRHVHCLAAAHQHVQGMRPHPVAAFTAETDVTCAEPLFPHCSKR